MQYDFFRKGKADELNTTRSNEAKYVICSLLIERERERERKGGVGVEGLSVWSLSKVRFIDSSILHLYYVPVSVYHREAEKHPLGWDN